MKRIVICADGTWNQRDQVDPDSGKRRPTNVTKIARAVLSKAPDGVDQVVFYDTGVGTSGPLDRLTGGAMGQGIEENIRELYRCILYNHEVGDELYLFGFSRGAYTVRSLAGFMHLCGLVGKGDDYYVPEMYELYAKGCGPGSQAWEQTFTRENGTRRIHQVRPCPPITFLGVWDTVGALRDFWGSQRHKHHKVDLNDSIVNAVHALAIDEHRKPFEPTMFKVPEGWPATARLHQAWFAGVHSGVGGSYKPDGLANEALHWMAAHAQQVGLALDWNYLWQFTPVVTSVMHDSMTPMYRLMGPIDRRIGALPKQGPWVQEAVHESVFRRMKDPACAYAPAHLPPDLPVVHTPDRPPPPAAVQALLRKLSVPAAT